METGTLPINNFELQELEPDRREEMGVGQAQTSYFSVEEIEKTEEIEGADNVYVSSQFSSSSSTETQVALSKALKSLKDEQGNYILNQESNEANEIITDYQDQVDDLSDDQATEELLNQILEEYAAAHGKSVEELTEEEIIAAVDEYIEKHVDYTKEEENKLGDLKAMVKALAGGETVAGDCEEIAILKAALLEAAGIDTQLGFTETDGTIDHVVVIVNGKQILNTTGADEVTLEDIVLKTTHNEKGEVVVVDSEGNLNTKTYALNTQSGNDDPDYIHSSGLEGIDENSTPGDMAGAVEEALDYKTHSYKEDDFHGETHVGYKKLDSEGLPGYMMGIMRLCNLLRVLALINTAINESRGIVLEELTGKKMGYKGMAEEVANKYAEGKIKSANFQIQDTINNVIKFNEDLYAEKTGDIEDAHSGFWMGVWDVVSSGQSQRDYWEEMAEVSGEYLEAVEATADSLNALAKAQANVAEAKRKEEDKEGKAGPEAIMQEAKEKLKSQLGDVTLVSEDDDGYLEPDMTKVEELRFNFGAFQNLQRAIVMLETDEAEVTNIVKQELTGISGRKSRANTVQKMYEEKLSFDYMLFETTASMNLQKIQVNNMKRYCELQYDKVSSAGFIVSMVFSGIFRLASLVLAVAALVPSPWQALFAGLSILCTFLADLLSWASTYAADSAVDDEIDFEESRFKPKDDDFFGLGSPENRIAANSANDPKNIHETDDEMKVLDTPDLAKDMLFIQGIQNLKRFYAMVMKEKAQTRNLVHMEMTGVGGRESSPLAITALEEGFGMTQFLFSMRLFLKQMQLEAFNREKQQDRNMEAATKKFLLSSSMGLSGAGIGALCAGGNALGGAALGYALGSLIGNLIGEIWNNWWAQEMNLHSNVNFDKIMEELTDHKKEYNSTESKMKRLELMLLEEMLMMGMQNAGDGYKSLNFKGIAGIKVQIRGLYNLRRCLSRLHTVEAETRSLVHQEMTGMRTRKTSEYVEIIDRSDFEALMQAANLIEQFKTAQVEYANRIRDAEKARIYAWIKFGVGLFLIAISSILAGFKIIDLNLIMPIVQVANSFIDLVTSLVTANTNMEIDDISEEDILDIIKRHEEDLDNTVYRDINQDLIGTSEGGNKGINAGYRILYQDLMQRVYRIKEALAQIQASEAESRARIHAAYTGIAGLTPLGKGAYAIDKAIALDLVGLFFNRLEAIVRRYNQINAARRNAWVAGFSFLVSVIVFYIAVHTSSAKLKTTKNKEAIEGYQEILDPKSNASEAAKANANREIELRKLDNAKIKAEVKPYQTAAIIARIARIITPIIVGEIYDSSGKEEGKGPKESDIKDKQSGNQMADNMNAAHNRSLRRSLRPRKGGQQARLRKSRNQQTVNAVLWQLSEAVATAFVQLLVVPGYEKDYRTQTTNSKIEAKATVARLSAEAKALTAAVAQGKASKVGALAQQVMARAQKLSKEIDQLENVYIKYGQMDKPTETNFKQLRAAIQNLTTAARTGNIAGLKVSLDNISKNPLLQGVSLSMDLTAALSRLPASQRPLMAAAIQQANAALNAGNPKQAQAAIGTLQSTLGKIGEGNPALQIDPEFQALQDNLGKMAAKIAAGKASPKEAASLLQDTAKVFTTALTHQLVKEEMQKDPTLTREAAAKKVKAELTSGKGKVLTPEARGSKGPIGMRIGTISPHTQAQVNRGWLTYQDPQTLEFHPYLMANSDPSLRGMPNPINLSNAVIISPQDFEAAVASIGQSPDPKVIVTREETPSAFPKVDLSQIDKSGPKKLPIMTEVPFKHTQEVIKQALQRVVQLNTNKETLAKKAARQVIINPMAVEETQKAVTQAQNQPVATAVAPKQQQSNATQAHLARADAIEKAMTTPQGKEITNQTALSKNGTPLTQLSEKELIETLFNLRQQRDAVLKADKGDTAGKTAAAKRIAQKAKAVVSALQTKVKARLVKEGKIKPSSMPEDKAQRLVEHETDRLIQKAQKQSGKSSAKQAESAPKKTTPEPKTKTTAKQRPAKTKAASGVKAADTKVSAKQAENPAVTEARAELEALKSQKNQARAKLGDLNTQLKTLTKKIEQKTAKAELAADRAKPEIQKLKQEIAKIELNIRSYESLKTEHRPESKEFILITNMAKEARAQKQVLGQKIEQINAKTEQAQTEAVTHKQAAQQVQHQITRVTAEIKATETQIAEVKAALAALEGSKSPAVKETGRNKTKAREKVKADRASSVHTSSKSDAKTKVVTAIGRVGTNIRDQKEQSKKAPNQQPVVPADNIDIPVITPEAPKQTRSRTMAHLARAEAIEENMAKTSAPAAITKSPAVQIDPKALPLISAKGMPASQATEKQLVRAVITQRELRQSILSRQNQNQNIQKIQTEVVALEKTVIGLKAGILPPPAGFTAEHYEKVIREQIRSKEKQVKGLEAASQGDKAAKTQSAQNINAEIGAVLSILEGKVKQRLKKSGRISPKDKKETVAKKVQKEVEFLIEKESKTLPSNPLAAQPQFIAPAVNEPTASVQTHAVPNPAVPLFKDIPLERFIAEAKQSAKGQSLMLAYIDQIEKARQTAQISDPAAIEAQDVPAVAVNPKAPPVDLKAQLESLKAELARLQAEKAESIHYIEGLKTQLKTLNRRLAAKLPAIKAQEQAIETNMNKVGQKIVDLDKNIIRLKALLSKQAEGSKEYNLIRKMITEYQTQKEVLLKDMQKLNVEMELLKSEADSIVREMQQVKEQIKAALKNLAQIEGKIIETRSAIGQIIKALEEAEKEQSLDKARDKKKKEPGDKEKKDSILANAVKAVFGSGNGKNKEQKQPKEKAKPKKEILGIKPGSFISTSEEDLYQQAGTAARAQKVLLGNKQTTKVA